MAFVTPLPFTPSLITRPSLSLPSTHYQPRANRRARVACLSMTADSASAIIYRVVRPTDIDSAYTIWNKVAEYEGNPAPRHDEHDNHETTAHILARSSEGHVVGAARLLREGHNVRLDRVCVLPSHRGRGIGRSLVERLLVMAAPVQGAIYVNATRGEMGFFSIMGFETLGNDKVEDGVVVRTMVYRIPVCVTSTGCVGLHHTSLRVRDIERSLAFYGCLGFWVTEKFLTTHGERACYVEGLGTRLEFVEAMGRERVQGVPVAGFERLVFDVTKACTDLESYLQHLERRNGGELTVAVQPEKQVLGGAVAEVACIEDPDGLRIQFIKREARVPGELRTRVNW